MPKKHAKLSPSASERWLQCPASVRMEELVPPQPESDYAAEGTLAHTLGELKAGLAFDLITKEQFGRRRGKWARELRAFLGDVDDVEFEEVVLEMERHTDAYVELIRERLELYPNSQVMLEQKLDTGVPSCWGTSDAVIVSPVHVEIIDFKYGQGVAVEAEGNSQLRLYGLGALDAFGDVLGDTEVVRMTVHQPRLSHVLTEQLSADELRAWRDENVIPQAELALGDDAPFGPSDEACRWCPASGMCKAQLEAVFATDFEEKPEAMSPEDMAEVLPRLPMVRDWLKAFEEAALDTAYSRGLPIPGYKVVRSGGQRKITAPEEAITYLTTKRGFAPEEVTKTSIRGIGELEKLMGVSEFAEELADFITKSDGRPSLVPEDDSRPAINPHTEAVKEFTDGTELL